jgi:hypothetical protein
MKLKLEYVLIFYNKFSNSSILVWRNAQRNETKKTFPIGLNSLFDRIRVDLVEIRSVNDYCMQFRNFCSPVSYLYVSKDKYV